jgi:histone-lysine N-methyltransferase SUV39H
VVGQPPYRRGLLNDAWNGRSYEGDKLTIYECTSACACRKTPDKPCQNNVIGQHKRPWKLELFKTVDRGWGVRTREFIPRGAFIAEYIGEIISRETGVLRDTAYHIAQLLYMFNLDRFVGADDPNMLV